MVNLQKDKFRKINSIPSFPVQIGSHTGVGWKGLQAPTTLFLRDSHDFTLLGWLSCQSLGKAESKNGLNYCHWNFKKAFNPFQKIKNNHQRAFQLFIWLVRKGELECLNLKLYRYKPEQKNQILSICKNFKHVDSTGTVRFLPAH